MEKHKALVINIYGGPGSGKSTTAAAVFAELKLRGYNVELVTEYAKGMTWQNSFKVLKNQIYVFGKQHHYLTRPQDQVDFIVTDSPLLMSIAYDMFYEGDNGPLKKLVKYEYDKMKNLDIYLTRNSPYQQAGRSQSEEKARELDSIIHGVLSEYGPGFHTIIANREAIQTIVSTVVNMTDIKPQVDQDRAPVKKTWSKRFQRLSSSLNKAWKEFWNQ